MKIRRVDFSPDEFLAGVAGMSPTEVGVYWTICSLIYSSGGPISSSDKRLARILRCRGGILKETIKALVVSGKVQLIDNQLHVKRCQTEIQSASKRIQTAHENASRRMPNRVKANEINAVEPPGVNFSDDLTITYQLSTITTKEEEPLPIIPPLAGRDDEQAAAERQQQAREEAQRLARQLAAEFTEWWALYPHKIGKKAALQTFGKVRKSGVGQTALLPGVRRYIAAKPDDREWCNPATWLNQGRWEDEPAGSAEPVPVYRSQAEQEWRYRVWRFRNEAGQWDAQWGPQPGQSGCRAPADALQAYGFQPRQDPPWVDNDKPLAAE